MCSIWTSRLHLIHRILVPVQGSLKYLRMVELKEGFQSTGAVVRTGSYRLQREILTLCLTCPAQERPRGAFVVVEQAHDHHHHHSHHDNYDHDLHKLQFSCNIKRQKELRTVQNGRNKNRFCLQWRNFYKNKKKEKKSLVSFWPKDGSRVKSTSWWLQSPKFVISSGKKKKKRWEPF